MGNIHWEQTEIVLGTDAAEIIADAAAHDLALPAAFFVMALGMEAPEIRNRIAENLAGICRDWRDGQFKFID